MTLPEPRLPEPIAIVGLGGVFPGAASPDQLWEIVAAGVDTGQRVEPGRWGVPPETTVVAGAPQPDLAYSDWGCFIDQRSFTFDPHGWQVDPALLAPLDPLYHYVLMATKQAVAPLRLGGVTPERCGVILGQILLPTESTSDGAWACYRDQIVQPGSAHAPDSAQAGGALADDECAPLSPLNRLAAGLPAGLVSAALGWRGRTFTLDAACASSLYAVEYACRELRSGRADVMLAGGVSRPDLQYTQVGFAQLQALSKQGRCAPLSAAADGLVVGEGAGVVVLKRLGDALAAGDPIWATVAACGLSNDRGANLLAPKSEGQLRAMRAAYARAGWSPHSVQFMECHATGTPIGDGVELASLAELWRNAPAPAQCVLGAIKSNIGHLLTAAGSAGLAKVLLALRHKTLPPTANFDRPAAALPGSGHPLRVLPTAQPWPAPADRLPRRATVNGFGFGGINAHLLIEEWSAERADEPRRARPQTAPTPEIEGEPIVIVACEMWAGALRGIGAVGRWLIDGAAPSARSDSETPLYPFGKIALIAADLRIPPLELPDLLPQQLAMMGVARSALAQCSWNEPLGERGGVYVGATLDLSTTNFHVRWKAKEVARLQQPAEAACTSKTEVETGIGVPLTSSRVMGHLGAITASRLARLFDAGGPCHTVSAEENSGLQALSLAIEALEQHELDVALVGAIDLPTELRSRQAFDAGNPALGVLARTDAAVALVLMREQDALSQQRPILARVTRPEFVGGRTSAGQSTIGTGWSAAEDRLVLQQGPRSAGETACPLGYTGAAQGLVSVALATLALAEGVLPASVVLPTSTVLPGAGERTARPWLVDRAQGLRSAEICQSAQDGSAARVTLWEADHPERTLVVLRDRPTQAALFVIEYTTPAERDEQLAALQQLATQADSLLAAARLWHRQRKTKTVEKYQSANGSAPYAFTCVARTLDQLQEQLTHARLASSLSPSVAAGRLLDRRSVWETATDQAGPGQVAFVFPGSGYAFVGMGRELLAAFPEVIQRQHSENLRLASQYHVQQIWDGASTAELLADQKAMIFGQVALGTAICDLLRLFGVQCDTTLGYSLGESAALFGVRAWTARDEMLARMEASPLFGSDLVAPFDAARTAWGAPPDEPIAWRAGFVQSSAEAVRLALVGLERVYLLIEHSPSQCIVGGWSTSVDQLVERLGVDFFPVAAPSTVHCEVLRAVEANYQALHTLPVYPLDSVDVYSTAWQRRYTLTTEHAAQAIVAQAVETISFPGVVRVAWQEGVRTFIEIGPGHSCTRSIMESLAGLPYTAVAVHPAGTDPFVALLKALAELIAVRVPVQLDVLYGSRCAERTSRPQPLPPVNSPTQVEVHSNEPWIHLPQKLHAIAWPARLRPRCHTPLTPLCSERGTESAVVVEPARHRPVLPAPVSTPSVLPLTGSASALTMTTSSLSEPTPPVFDPAPVVDTAPVSDAKTSDVKTGAQAPLQPEPLALLSTLATGTTQAHAAYLQFSGQLQQLMARVATMPTPSAPPVATPEPATPPAWEYPTQPPRALSREQCMEFAIGSIGRVLGSSFAAIDAGPTRVRLPDEPLMLVDRITAIEGEPLSMTHGRVVTEHDVTADRWYLDEGRIPTAVAVESGQADLFLAGWLGIDLQTRGLATYRLLDAVVTFHRSLPVVGDTIRYDIRLNEFFRQGETILFRFEFDSTVHGEPLLTMRSGCAGFFTAAELAAGKGVVHTALDRQPRAGKLPTDWQWPVPLQAESLCDEQVQALYRGDLAGGLGPLFAGLPLHQPVTLPVGRLELVHRVLSIEPGAGKYGLGRIRAEADIHPTDWFLTCHFCDDNVMPGTLMYECCLHTLRILLLRMGWIGARGVVHTEPVPGVASRLKCRGQVTETTRQVWYEVTLKELGYGPDAYCLADALMYADGRPIVEITDMSIRLVGLTQHAVSELWSSAARTRSVPSPASTPVQPVSTTGQPVSKLKPVYDVRPAIYPLERITAFAIGKPSEAFGERYLPFDHERKIARLPGPPFQFLDRIVEVTGQPWVMQAGATCVAQYDIPADAWYFAANRQPHMPFAVLLETALQPCGWLAGYVGSALCSETDLSFRNLGGQAIQHEVVTPESGTLTTAVKLTSASMSGGMIIQHFTFELSCQGRPVYTGTTYFGFFSREALANQVGLRDTRLTNTPTLPVPQLVRSDAPFPAPQFRMVDLVESYDPQGGPAGLGVIRGTIGVDPAAWFFQAHFFEDPVWPGSLGLESFLQVLKEFAVRRWGAAENAVFQTIDCGHRHEWVYRGQVIPPDHLVTVEAVITQLDDEARRITADGLLVVDGRTIYQMKQFTLRLA